MILTTVIAFVFVLSIVVFVHEFGHFFVAKLNKIFVMTFSFGFGKKLLRKQIGETEFVLSAIPFGGYVKFAGETEEDEQTEEQDKELEVFVPENRLYRNKHPLQRMSTVLAGPVMNAIFALLIFIGSLWIQGVNVQPGTTVLGVDEGSPAEAAGFLVGDAIISINGEDLEYWSDIATLITYEEGIASEFVVKRGGENLRLEAAPEYDPDEGIWRLGLKAPLPAKVGKVKKGSPAEKAGIRRGAVILSINDTTVTAYKDLEEFIHPRPGVPMEFEWELDGEIHSAEITPASIDAPSGGERIDVIKVGGIGIGPPYEMVRIPFGDAVRYGSRGFVDLVSAILGFLKKLVTGKATIRAVGGPLRVGIMAGDMLAWGFGYLVYFLAFFSLNLAIFNLLPVLPFDGGHFVLYMVELVSGRSINRRVQQVMMQVGFIILVVLMVFILFMDIFNIFS
ncbi:MAG: RIP metalloprotease RseP [Candidatus Krumholzibacteria bacterium]|nr:RIP metalloprotease RseP [Candidatus Krumholzibacteria bacterium]